MPITLSVSPTTVTLPEDLLWVDELSWSGVEQAVERTVSGALVVQVAEAIGGRPITLQPEDDSSAWMDRSLIEQLRVWAAIPGQQMVLNVRGVARTVIFRHQDGAIEAAPVVHYNDVIAGDKYTVITRFMEVTA